jgi:hypothetical protein
MHVDLPFGSTIVETVAGRIGRGADTDYGMSPA